MLLRRILRRPSARPTPVLGSGPWRVTAATVAGTAHRRSGEPGQDAFQWALGPEECLVVAVADGAGLASMGREGARLAVDTAVAHFTGLRSLPAGDALRLELAAALEGAMDALNAEAESLEVSVRELATTLILLVAAPELVGVAQVGDGAAVLGDSEGSLVAHTTPQVGQHINETMFISSPEAMDWAQVEVWETRTACGAVFSDGVQMLAMKMPEGTPHGPFFKPLFRFALDLPVGHSGDGRIESFLRSSRISDNTTDDLTLLLFSLEDESNAAGKRK